MDLLKQIVEQPIDPDYAIVAARGERSSHRRWMMLITLVVAGSLLAIAVMQNFRTAPVRATERQELVTRINDAQGRQDQLRVRTDEQAAEIRRLRQANLGTTQSDQQLRDEVARLELVAATVAVTGPGIVVVVDDGPGSDPQDQVIDTDLQQLVNGLWMAGAEAVTINGYRLTTLTPIRGAGEAITVDYRSLTRPYRVEAIGDPRTLQSRYLDSSGGIWWSALKRNYGVRHDVTSADELTLAGDAGITLRHARKGA